MGTIKLTRSRYTLEFKLEAVRLVKAGQSVRAVAQTLDISPQTLLGWVDKDKEGTLSQVKGKVVTQEQMELARARSEIARLKMEVDILKKATAYFARDLK
jgi:transposase